MQNATIASILARYQLFDGLAPTTLERLAASTVLRSFRRNATILLKGSRTSLLLLVHSGMIKETCLSPAGEERVLELHGPGAVCAEFGLFLDAPAPCSLVALTHADLLFIDRRPILDLLVRDPVFVNSLARHLSQRVVRLLEEIESTTRKSPLERISTFLLDLAANASDGNELLLPATKRVIAARMGICSEAFSRALRDLVEAGIIGVRGQRIQIRQWQRLIELAGYSVAPQSGTRSKDSAAPTHPNTLATKRSERPASRAGRGVGTT